MARERAQQKRDARGDRKDRRRGRSVRAELRRYRFEERAETVNHAEQREGCEKSRRHHAPRMRRIALMMRSRYDRRRGARVMIVGDRKVLRIAPQHPAHYSSTIAHP